MAEPTEAEKNRVWELVEQIEDETVKPDTDWSRVRRWVGELDARIRSFQERPER